MNWIPVESSNIEAVSYDAAHKILSVRFHKSGVYRYAGVSEEIYKEFLGAESKGKFFIQHIKGHFDYFKPEEEKDGRVQTE